MESQEFSIQLKNQMKNPLKEMKLKQKILTAIKLIKIPITVIGIIQITLIRNIFLIFIKARD